MANKKSKILGSLLGAAVGDAMGAATETRTTALIKKQFNGLVTDFVEPPCDNLARGTEAGVVTDDFSIAYFTAEEMLKAQSSITKEIAEEALVRWSKHPEYTRFIGPTTRAAIDVLINPATRVEITKLKGEVESDSGIPDSFFDGILCNNSRVTNGAGMKAGIIGLFNINCLDKAIDDAIVMCLPTHNNTIALSGGCAIATATAKALEDNVSYYEVIEAGIYGAAEGFKRAEKIARPVAGGNIEKKIRLAVEIGMRNQDDFEKAMNEISDIIGGGLYAYEAIPAVFGHIAACKGRVMDSILMGVNAGDDTDTVACMTGFITGALCGIEVIPGNYLELIDKMNNFNLAKMANDIDELIKR